MEKLTQEEKTQLKELVKKAGAEEVRVLLKEFSEETFATLAKEGTEKIKKAKEEGRLI